MAEIQNESEDISKEIKTENDEEKNEQTKTEIKIEIINEQQQQTSITSEILQTDIVKLTVENEMPIEDLRKLYTSSSNIVNIPTSKQEEISSSSEDSTDQEDDSGYQRLLIAEHPTLNENGDEETMDDSSISFYWQKAINIGEPFQAIVPDLLTTTDQIDQEIPNDQLLWSPPTIDANDDENSALVNKYLKLAAKEYRTADQENVLEVFLSSNYNIDQALEKLRLPTTNKNFFSSTPWSGTECDQFEQCFKEHGKDFSMFKIPNRTVSELVFFYYIWKKSARHDVFVRQNRVEKRRFHLHPYVTDYLEKFLVEQELQLIHAYEQNNSSASTTNPQSSGGDHLISKRRSSSDLFLKPMSTVKRNKSLIQPNDNDHIEPNEYQQTIRSTSPILTKKLHDEVK